MGKYPNLTEAENTIMEIIWSEQEVTSKDVVIKVQKDLGWSRQTVKTYLDRLQEKGLINVRKLSPRVHFYSCAISKSEYASSITEDHLKKYFNGLPDMMAGLIKKENISDEELDNLEKLIKDYRNKNR